MKHAKATKPSLNLSINVKVDGTSQVAYKNSNDTLLECLEKAGNQIHYHCRDGYCGACRITLTKGEIHYHNGEPLAYIGPNEILPCCCKPVSDIEITLL